MATTASARSTQLKTKRTGKSAKVSKTGSRLVKSRASQACEYCRLHKVRCNFIEDGIPCTNCRFNEVTCCVTKSNRRKKSSVQPGLPSISAPSIESTKEKDGCLHFTLFHGVDRSQNLLVLPQTSQFLSTSSRSLDQTSDIHKSHMIYQVQAARLTLDKARARQLAYLSARGIPFQTPAVQTSTSLPPFTLQHGTNLPNYIKVPQVGDRAGAEDLGYLRKKGAFSIPETALRNELLQCYTLYVHPYFPVLELRSFLHAIENNGRSTISLLLFQAVMFAASAYVDLRILHSHGYKTRRTAQKAFFQRVKLLYDLDYEIDRLTVVQSLLLMTFWYESPNETKDIWYWLGVAVSHARLIGVNRNTDSSHLLCSHERKLWKRIWWCCYIRDRLIALGLRRPFHIWEDEVEVSVLEVADFETEAFESELGILEGCSVVCDSAKRQLLARMCIEIVNCCRFIDRVLSIQYTIRGHRFGATQETTMGLVPRTHPVNQDEVKQCDQDIEHWYASMAEDMRYCRATSSLEQDLRPDGGVMQLHRALLTGIYLATSSALHRPQVMPTLKFKTTSDFSNLSKKRVHEASSAITGILSDLYGRNLIRYLPNTGVTIVLPAAIVHLWEIRSHDSLTRRLGVRNFRICTQALRKLRDIYASADFASAIIDAAVRASDTAVSNNVVTNNTSPTHEMVSRSDETRTDTIEMTNTSQSARSMTSLPTPAFPMATNDDLENTQGTICDPSGHSSSCITLTTASRGIPSQLTDNQANAHSRGNTSIMPDSLSNKTQIERMEIDMRAYIDCLEVHELMDQTGSSVSHAMGFESMDEAAVNRDFEELISLGSDTADIDGFIC